MGRLLKIYLSLFFMSKKYFPLPQTCESHLALPGLWWGWLQIMETRMEMTSELQKSRWVGWRCCFYRWKWPFVLKCCALNCSLLTKPFAIFHSLIQKPVGLKVFHWHHILWIFDSSFHFSLLASLIHFWEKSGRMWCVIIVTQISRTREI